MKPLLTPGGVTNPTVRTVLLHLLGKPIEEASALHPDGHVRPPDGPARPRTAESATEAAPEPAP